MNKPFDRDSRKYGYSLDRIDPTQGYTKDNIWVISQIAFARWVLSLEGGELL